MKVRVYELAKEAGMDSKELAAKLIELGYDVKAYNSSLDEGTAEEIRQKLMAIETQVQEKRIQTKGRTTIIRRRQKSVENLEGMASPEPVVDEEGAGDTSDELPDVAHVEATIGDSEVQESPEAHNKLPSEESGSDESGGAPVKETIVAAAIEKETGNTEAPVLAEAVAPTEPVLAEDHLSAREDESSEEKDEDDAATQAEETRIRKGGFARVIKRAAIHIPVEEPRRPAPKKPVVKAKPPRKGVEVKSTTPVDNASPVGTDSDDASGKGKKGKRFVKFTHHSEPGARGKKGPLRNKGFVDVDMEDVAMAGGRFSSALKVGRGGRSGGKKHKGGSGDDAIGETKAIKRRIKVYDSISIGDLAHRMGVKVSELIAKLMSLGVMATVNQSLDTDTATLVATDFGYEVEQGETEEITITNFDEQEGGGVEVPRPPVVTVMGHVDHGKTSILDAIRNTDVAAGEAGGITQHIGAHYVRSKHGDVVFLDTPGHAAFTEMRSRGTKVTDVVVLVVAADDGVMDQTKEAINHAKAAEVPIVVAVNKIDKENADVMRVKRELADHNLVAEDWGGDTIFCEVSAKKNIGIDTLLEQIILQSEIIELKADPSRKAKGCVVEAHLHRGRGPLATVLVQEGTLRVGDHFVVGNHYGKVRSLLDDKGERIDEAGPARPVEVQGLSGVPMSGDEFVVVPDEKMAKNVSSQRQMKSRENLLGRTTKISLDNLFDKLQEGDIKELKVLLRADVQGTLEAFSKALAELGTDLIRVRVLHEGTGTITDSDVLLAAASEAIIIGFNVRPSAKVKEFANSENVDLRFYDVIYHAIDDIRSAMTGMLDPTYEERVIGTVEVRETFTVPKIGTISGSYVLNGKVERSAQVRLIRDGIVLFTGKISSLRRFKDDVKEVQSGYECGVGIENYNDIQVGDTMEVFVMDEVAGKL